MRPPLAHSDGGRRIAQEDGPRAIDKSPRPELHCQSHWGITGHPRGPLYVRGKRWVSVDDHAVSACEVLLGSFLPPATTSHSRTHTLYAHTLRLDSHPFSHKPNI